VSAGDVTLSAQEADTSDCLLRTSLARLPPGGALTVEGADGATRDRLLERCRRLGYRAAAGPGGLTVGKQGAPTGGRPGEVGHSWSVRGHSADGRQTRLHAGRHSFSAGPAVSFRPDEPLPSAVEHLLAALAADLIGTFAGCLRERGVQLDAVECRLTGRLDDPLASIGVVGAAGSPAISVIEGAVYVSAEAWGPPLEDAWCAALARSPLFNTLAPCVELRVDMRLEV
jgi:hypothetical protein